MKRNEIITDIGERLTDALYELNDSFEWDYYDVESRRSYTTHVPPASSMSMAARSTMCRCGLIGHTSVKTRWKWRSPAAKARLAAGSTTTAWNKPS